MTVGIFIWSIDSMVRQTFSPRVYINKNNRPGHSEVGRSPCPPDIPPYEGEKKREIPFATGFCGRFFLYLPTVTRGRPAPDGGGISPARKTQKKYFIVPRIIHDKDGADRRTEALGLKIVE